jgi:hypothetical protein
VRDKRIVGGNRGFMTDRIFLFDIPLRYKAAEGISSILEEERQDQDPGSTEEILTVLPTPNQ